MTTTPPVLDCLWLGKVTHTHAKTQFNALKSSQPQIPAKEARGSLHLPTIHTKHGGQHGEGKPSSQTATMFTLEQNLKDTDQPSKLRRTCHALPSPSAQQDAFRIRTTHVSFRLRVIPGTTCPGQYGSSRPPLPTPSLVGRKSLCRWIHVVRGTARHYPRCFHPNCLTTQRSHFPIARISRQSSCADRSRHMLSLLRLECWPKPKHLPEDHRLFLQRKKKSSP